MNRIAQLSSEPWGALPNGDACRLYTLRNARGMRVQISDLGATLVSWHAPDRTGRLADILLGHDTPTAYYTATTYMGGLIGRWANRIADARFTLDGVDYRLDRNENGNLLHGGANGFHRAIWQAEDERGALLLRLESPAGNGGFPGNVSVQVRYTLDDDGTLTIDYEASSDAPTPLNLTSHGYFNLSGEPGSDIRDHILTIDADAYLEVDPRMIPIGMADVSGTAFDFREGAPLGTRLDSPHAQIALAGGVDHCYIVRDAARTGHAPAVRSVANVYEPRSGRELTVATDQRGLQCYTGNYLEGQPGRHGAPCVRHAALCLEAGGFPNQINMEAPECNDLVLRPGGTYRQVTQYKAGVRS
ncbi:Aldose 1-epimerase [Paraburkholderia caffeinitolerans]|uniref:Aldose 1-epimerase n=1 Tax=Paraburkholderia caffeinitolerans TaxID=1723730 RepID=A0A6J5GP55_9BURK|nr:MULTISPECIES: aldose epimerase family protein [Paraburkholderia]CAB3804501.1 Aldose 1-epimerase [Paraburkholderia caffeinitolerans]